MARERPPSFPFYPANWFADTRHMSRDQRCRYFEAILQSWVEKSYGVAPEDQWRVWLGYTRVQWVKARSIYAGRFDIQADGTWVQRKLVEVRTEQQENFKRASRGGTAAARLLKPDERSHKAQVAANTRWNARLDAHLMPTPAFASASASRSDSEKPLTPVLSRLAIGTPDPASEPKSTPVARDLSRTLTPTATPTPRPRQPGKPRRTPDGLYGACSECRHPFPARDDAQSLCPTCERKAGIESEPPDPTLAHDPPPVA